MLKFTLLAIYRKRPVVRTVTKISLKLVIVATTITTIVLSE